MNSPRRNQTPAAFSLVEVTIALGIMAFCMVAIFGLLPTGYSSNQAAIEQTTAATIASALINDIRQAPLQVSGTSAEPQSPHFLLSVPLQTGSVVTETHTLFLTQDGSVADASAGTASAQDKDADPTQNPRFRATMVFTVPALGTAPPPSASGVATTGVNHAATMLRLLITWPALADRKGGILPTSQSFSFETMVALDRN